MDIPVHIDPSDSEIRAHTREDQEHRDQVRPLGTRQSKSKHSKPLFERIMSATSVRRAFSRRDRDYQSGPTPVVVPQWDDKSTTVIVDNGSWPADNKALYEPRQQLSIRTKQQVSRNRSLSGSKYVTLEGGPQRSISKRERVAQAIANPDALFKSGPTSPSTQSKLNPNPNGKIIRTFFSNNLDMAPSAPQASYIATAHPYRLPHAELPLFSPHLVSQKVATELPAGYTIRPLCRGDYSRRYMDVVRVLGKTGTIDEGTWERRCEWLRAMGETYFIVVILDPDDVVAATGTVIVERKFVFNMGLVGRIEDIAVARAQKGKKMGLRVLEALMFVSVQAGCYKTIVNCTEANEAFHGQAGFVKEGTQMVLTHSRKVVD